MTDGPGYDYQRTAGPDRSNLLTPSDYDGIDTLECPDCGYDCDSREQLIKHCTIVGEYANTEHRTFDAIEADQDDAVWYVGTGGRTSTKDRRYHLRICGILNQYHKRDDTNQTIETLPRRRIRTDLKVCKRCIDGPTQKHTSQSVFASYVRNNVSPEDIGLGQTNAKGDD